MVTIFGSVLLPNLASSSDLVGLVAAPAPAPPPPPPAPVKPKSFLDAVRRGTFKDPALTTSQDLLCEPNPDEDDAMTDEDGTASILAAASAVPDNVVAPMEELQAMRARIAANYEDVFGPTASSSASSPPPSSSAGATSESNLRRQILMIQQDKSLPDSEKARRIQQLMSGNYAHRLPGTAVAGAAAKSGTGAKQIPVYNEVGQIRDEERAPMYHDEERHVFGCKHYMRSVKLQSHCCGKWVVCRFCHDEVSDHAIIRQKTKLMMCMRCFEVQPCSQYCVNPACGVKVSRYYCNECKLWDDDPKKNIYHCFDCGICRIGKGLGQDYFHCKKCNVCMAIGLKDRHKCIERNLESDCPICGEYMFTSTTTVIFMPCGHCIHHKCYQEHIQTSYTCPTCCKSLGNMAEYFARIDAAVAAHAMPPEYQDLVSLIFCNDCEARSLARYHFMYHKCSAPVEAPVTAVSTSPPAPPNEPANGAGAAAAAAAPPPGPGAGAAAGVPIPGLFEGGAVANAGSASPPPARTCASYNTKVLQTFRRGSPEEAQVCRQFGLKPLPPMPAAGEGEGDMPAAE
ncbi:hypothetical protein GGF32_008538 [Allomyces javanicus]|nr:hypothetical protein GGF32_008538 [Allomyces javanicus]